MKKLFVILMILAVLAALCGCGNSSDPVKSDGSGSVNSVNDVLQQQMNADEAQSTEEIPGQTGASEGQPVQASAPVYDRIDVDLTRLSSTMVYSEVYNMLMDPDSYLGQVVKMDGQFALYQSYDADGNLAGDQIYFACVVADATACCAQGIEFVPRNGIEYPKDFPEVGGHVTVTGVFKEYYEGDTMFIHLENAQVIAG